MQVYFGQIMMPVRFFGLDIPVWVVLKYQKCPMLIVESCSPKRLAIFNNTKCCKNFSTNSFTWYLKRKPGHLFFYLRDMFQLINQNIKISNTSFCQFVVGKTGFSLQIKHTWVKSWVSSPIPNYKALLGAWNSWRKSVRRETYPLEKKREKTFNSYV